MPNDVEAVYPLSPLQQGLLFHTLSRPGEPTYFEQIQCAIAGSLDLGGFGQAWDWVVRRHAVLRTAFAWQRLKEPVQVVGRTAPLPVDWQDWRDRPGLERDWERLLRDDRARGFDMARAPLMRLTLRQVADDRHLFVWSHHHILLDGWSFGIVLHEVLQCYADIVRTGRPTDAPSARPFGDFIGYLKERDAATDDKFWHDYLEDFSSPGHLAVDKGRGVLEGGSSDEATISLTLSAEASKVVQEQCARLGISLSALVHAAWARLLAAYSGESEVMFGSTTAGRPPELAGVEHMVGLFINAVPLRVRVDPGQRVSDWLSGIQGDLFRLQAHQFSGLARIQELSATKRGRPLFETLLSFQNYPLDSGHTESWAGIQLVDYEWSGPTNYPVAARAFPGEEVMLVLSYYRHRLDDATAEMMLGQFRSLVERMGTSPDQLIWEIEAVAGPHADQMIREWNATREPFDLDRTLHGLVEWQASVRPGAPAVVAADGRLTYTELDARAGQVARALRHAGVRPGDRVGLCTEKSTATVAGILGVMKAGAAYVPLDPSYPADRILYMARDAQISALLTWGRGTEVTSALDVPRIALDAGWPAVAALPGGAPDLTVTPETLAYVIYTSGSSGTPKGIMLDHRGRVNNVTDYCRRFDMGPRDRTLCVSSLSFDISVCDLFTSLGSGGCLVLPDGDREKDPEHWLELIDREGITLWHAAPALMDALLDAAVEREYRGDSLRLVVSDGDWIPLTQPERVRAAFPGARFISAGGATELSIDSVLYPVGDIDPAWRSIPYGTPMANQSAYILDENLQLAPVGVPGELCLGGAGMGAGYLGRPALTAEKFVPHPWPDQPGIRLYRTGDLARFGPDGVIELLGRIDFQVKIRGFRVELGEIETILREHPGVRAALAAAPPDASGERRLVAYVVPARPGDGADPDAGDLAAELRSWLRGRVPEHLVPAAFVWLERLPLTSNGKVNRRELPVPRFAPDSGARARPATELEARLARHWAQVLEINLADLDVESSFFDLGGNSLKALRACRVPELPVAITDLYRFSSVQSLAEHLSRGEGHRDALVRLTPAGHRASASGGADPAPTVICVPYGGGHVGVYQPLADALGDRAALYAVRLPGHEHDRADEPLEPVTTVAGAVAEAARGLSGRPLAVYGHCGGVALATEIARMLENAGADLRGLIVAAAYPSASAEELDDDPFAEIGDVELAEQFAELGAFAGLREDEALAIGRLLRHDGTEARRYFRDALAGSPVRVRAPLTCLIGDSDPLTAGYAEGWLGWGAFAEDQELVVFPGDHYFIREHAANVARHVLAALGAFDPATATPTEVTIP
jgi:amino acid adenylation domain-containing protein